MSSASETPAPPRGYLSEASKKRFTIVAGLLGGACFLAQVILPVAIMLLILMPTMTRQQVGMFDLDKAVLSHGELWTIERTTHVNWGDPGKSKTTFALAHVRLADLADAGPVIPLKEGPRDSTPELLPIGDRLWVIGANAIGYYERGSLTWLTGASRSPHVSRTFEHDGRPAVVSLGASPTLDVLTVNGTNAEWVSQDLTLDLPPELGSLQTVRAIEATGQLYLFAELCTREPDRCSINYRALDSKAWLPVVEEACSCADWTPLAMEKGVAVALVERQSGDARRLVIATAGPDGPQRREVTLGKDQLGFGTARPLALGSRLVLVSQSMPRSLRLSEVVDDRVTRSIKRPGEFPFGPNMMLLMWIPQCLPVVLSLALALVLTTQMRRHRVADYEASGDRRRFATLWQRALAQVVDLVPMGAAFALPAAFMWRLFSDPEALMEKGPLFPMWIFGLMAVACLCALLVLVVYSYLEGRFGKTPGKWLLRIRVLGTDLQPCGFGRALVRNLLTFVDGFFNFLVGALLVALTENWQRLGDLAARTIVVADERPA